jgi:hypothetical protein
MLAFAGGHCHYACYTQVYPEVLRASLKCLLHMDFLPVAEAYEENLHGFFFHGNKALTRL